MKITARSYQTAAALKKIRRDHPFRVQSPDFTLESLLDEVKDKLDSTRFEEIDRLAFSFNSKQMMACLEILARSRNDERVQKAYQVLKIRPRASIVLSGWFKLVNVYPHRLLEQVLREVIAANGFQILEKHPSISPKISAWFMSKRLPEGIIHDYASSTKKENFDDYLRENFLKDSEGLFRESWRVFLMKGNSDCLRRENEQRILSEFTKAENVQYSASFAQHYLNVLNSRENWGELILEFIADKFGPPYSITSEDDTDTIFWRGVKEDAKSEFSIWYMLKNIEEFFEGERADFWKKYVQRKEVRRVKKILDGNGFMLDFGAFGVIEFKNIGNAAYVYVKREFEKYWKDAKHFGYIWQFKDKSKTIRNKAFPEWDGRIIHRFRWQDKTSEMINLLLKFK